jgi:hypothetical protein
MASSRLASTSSGAAKGVTLGATWVLTDVEDRYRSWVELRYSMSTGYDDGSRESPGSQFISELVPR